jgi:hypothetical protein
MTNQKFPTPWLGSKYGYLTDWVTQIWVKTMGRAIDPLSDSWLLGPVGKARYIGKDYFYELASESDLTVDDSSPGRGLIQDFNALSGLTFNPEAVEPIIANFYEHTSDYDLDAWSEWRGIFRPFGWFLAFLFSRRLQQLNVPLSALDTSHGVTSDVIHLRDKVTGAIKYTEWVRELKRTRNVLYAGSYSLCPIPLSQGQCVKVVFPLPNGNVVIVMDPQQHADGSFSLASVGQRFGEAGFYFVVLGANGRLTAKYIRAFQEVIHVYADEDEDDGVRADHTLNLWGATFLRLHYRLRKRELQ